MQKKLSLALSIMLLTGLTNSVNAVDRVDILKIGGYLTTLTIAGNYATKMNEQYTKENKDPDAYMNFMKTTAAIGALVGLDILTGDLGKTPEIAVKVGSFLVALATQTEFAVNVAESLPYGAGGIFTNPKDENGKEKAGFGPVARFVCVYAPLRDQGLKMVNPDKYVHKKE